MRLYRFDYTDCVMDILNTADSGASNEGRKDIHKPAFVVPRRLLISIMTLPKRTVLYHVILQVE